MSVILETSNSLFSWSGLNEITPTITHRSQSGMQKVIRLSSLSQVWDEVYQVVESLTLWLGLEKTRASTSKYQQGAKRSNRLPFHTRSSTSSFPTISYSWAATYTISHCHHMYPMPTSATFSLSHRQHLPDPQHHHPSQ